MNKSVVLIRRYDLPNFALEAAMKYAEGYRFIDSNEALPRQIGGMYTATMSRGYAIKCLSVDSSQSEVQEVDPAIYGVVASNDSPPPAVGEAPTQSVTTKRRQTVGAKSGGE